MTGIVAYGAYVPYHRLERAAIAAALGAPPAKGSRAVASYDEDTTSMGVEAARVALRARPDVPKPTSLYFCTADPAYLDKPNATAVHAALGLDPSVLAVDMAGSVRSGVGATQAAAAVARNSPTLVVLSDIRTGLPSSAEEAAGGDGAAALLFGSEGVLAESLALASATGEFLDRWRLPGELGPHVWEERFGEHAYVPLAQDAITDALKQASVTTEQVDHFLVTGVHARAARALVRTADVRPEALTDDLTGVIGNTGTAHPGVLLADVLDRAAPGAVIVRVILDGGAAASVWRVTEEIEAYRAQRRTPTVADQIASGRTGLSYAQFLTWRGQLHREPPRRPDPQAPAAPPALRREAWKFGFTASRCEECGMRHLPPSRVCVRCRAADRMVPERLADTPATVATFAVDRLAYSPSPPLVAAVVDFDGGGRYRCEVTDVDPSAVAIGDRVEMTFRRLFTAGGVHNYFWKARPLRAADGDEEGSA